jgi:hypothetical protein
MEPSINQMEAVVAAGDDSRLNSLVLKTNGKYEMMDITRQIPAQVKYPDDVVVRFETFGQFNGYVGIDASKDDIFINNTFNDMMEMWEVYKTTGRTNLHSVS